ncbi:uncharacterized protein N7482_004778 [Penicillium canariense]|uniref:Uncharacterized protein n=1 Tax=Penicillium canariense TaxID=189055 RepID=A0A9W9I6Z1_9EURO|nr:uncharacterized protein N7482_004778 [Penicillium canariense]KAJ5169184.1 hypothetical protein N7482_004778 [Penicillium canariense]
MPRNPNPGDTGDSGNDPGNYDYPPASSRRPSRLNAPLSGPVTEQSFRERFPNTQQLIDSLAAQHNRLASETNLPPWDQFVIETLGNGETTASLSQLLGIPDNHLDQSNEALRESQRSTAILARTTTRDRLHYLRSLLSSESNRSNADDTIRALETLNQEIEDHHLDQIRDRTATASPFHIPRPPQIPPNSLRTSNRALWDQVRAEFGTAAQSPARTNASQDQPRPTTSSRSLRRRSFRPDLRGISTLNEPIPTPSVMPQPASAQSGRDGRGRLKRRKLESDDNREGLRGFNYGQYGQVVPGALKMEIASCDGGTFDPDGDSSFPENVLRNDQSVYCTKSDRCNLVLQHRGEAPFCLKKIVIKAPRTGFDSPIQEGMVFVSMTSDELLARTAQYQIQYSSTRRRRRNRRLGLQPSQEYLTAFRSPLQSLERTVLMGPDSHAASDEATERNANDPQTEFRITTEYDEHSEDSLFMEHEDDDAPSVAELERLQEEDDLLCSDSDDSASDDEDLDDTTMSGVHRRRLELQRLGSMQRRRPASLVDPLPPPSSAPPGSHAPPPNVEVLKPHARFFIEREKSMVSIKFDPPPSGRFILIKLWSPRSDGNIDIQSVIAHGYAGPRFFPSGGFR